MNKEIRTSSKTVLVQVNINKEIQSIPHTTEMSKCTLLPIHLNLFLTGAICGPIHFHSQLKVYYLWVKYSLLCLVQMWLHVVQ